MDAAATDPSGSVQQLALLAEQNMADFMVVIVTMIAWLQVALIGGFLVFAAGASATEKTSDREPYQPMRILAARAAAVKAASAKAAALPPEHRAAA